MVRDALILLTSSMRAGCNEPDYTVPVNGPKERPLCTISCWG